jgi:hypothetical protein
MQRHFCLNEGIWVILYECEQTLAYLNVYRKNYINELSNSLNNAKEAKSVPKAKMSKINESLNKDGANDDKETSANKNNTASKINVHKSCQEESLLAKAKYILKFFHYFYNLCFKKLSTFTLYNDYLLFYCNYQI